MSRVQGFFPLFLATAFGVANGIWVFGPAFKEQRENEVYPKTQLAASDEVDTARVEEIRTIEAAVSRASATQSAVKAAEKPTSWWTSIGTWGWGPGPVNGNTRIKEEGTAVMKSSPQDTNNMPQKPPTSDEAISKGPGSDIKDTVVGKLADRAASDPDLKSVLEAVASGKASTDQLKKFQVHLNEVTKS